MAEDKMRQLQLYEQSLQAILQQKQQFQSQIAEFDSALGELKNSTESFRIIGNVMVKADPKTLHKEIEDKQASLKMRLKSIDKQEDAIKEKAKGLRQEVLEAMKHEKEMHEVIELLVELSEDGSVPKNVKAKFSELVKNLRAEDSSVKVNKAMHQLEEIGEDNNLQSYVRTQIWNITSLLEKC